MIILVLLRLNFSFFITLRQFQNFKTNYFTNIINNYYIW